MKLVTFNIRCDYGQDGSNNFVNRRNLILKKVKKEQPDIICFQEVLPHVAHWLRGVLREYYVVGVGRDAELLDEQTAIAYRWDTVVLAGFHVFWLSPKPEIPGSRYVGQSICPRICTMALFQEAISLKLFRVFNVHLDHEGEESRIQAVKQVVQKTQEGDKDDSIPVILTGDFNAEPGSREMKILEENSSFRDATCAVKGTFHEYGTLEKEKKIDYIFMKGNVCFGHVKLWKENEGGVYLSDHYPISLEFDFYN